MARQAVTVSSAKAAARSTRALSGTPTSRDLPRCGGFTGSTTTYDGGAVLGSGTVPEAAADRGSDIAAILAGRPGPTRWCPSLDWCATGGARPDPRLT
ncbi:hypothetical protein GCM10027270_05640 [Nocardioides ginkgobilobae]